MEVVKRAQGLNHDPVPGTCLIMMVERPRCSATVTWPGLVVPFLQMTHSMVSSFPRPPGGGRPLLLPLHGLVNPFQQTVEILPAHL